MGYTNSPLVSYTKLSPNHSGQRTHSIDRITPHCVVGQCSVETLGNIFAPTSRQASCTYGIGVDGRVGMYVEEKNRSWCSSSNANDQRAVTIECASDNTHPYAFKDIVYNRLIELCVDICKRNGKSKLLWLSDKDKTLNYEPKSDEMILTVHRWFANKSCPGDWMYARMGDLATKVTAQLTSATPSQSEQSEKPVEGTLYRVQTGAFKVKKNADALLKKVKAAGFDAFITQIGELYKVQVGAYKVKANAEKQMEKVKAAGFDTIIVTVGETSTTQPVQQTDDTEKTIWDTLKGFGFNDFAVAGIMGNLYAESGLRPNNLQQTYEKSLGMTDESYTKGVDDGSYKNFVKDSAGYGLAQWTYWSRKQALKEHADWLNVSIGDLTMQLDFLWKEIQGYSKVMSVLKEATSVRQASDVVLIYYEAPASKDEEATQAKRASYGQKYYDKYASGQTTPVTPTVEFKPYLVKVTATVLNIRKSPSVDSAKVGAIYDSGVYTIVEESKGNGASMWGRLKSGAGWISLDYTKKLREV